MLKKHPKYGDVPWHEKQPGDEILIAKNYHSVVTKLKRWFPGTAWRSTTRGVPEGKRKLIRIR